MVMKKISFIIVVFIAVFFGSCKKNWICKCTQSGSTLNPVVVEYPKYGTKKQATSECEGLSTSGIGAQTCVLVY